ncbi:MAG TPA: DUF1697 domain-containing protein [Candidatus Krumholzibacteria bacterium]|nr:DUF1697 domain-containing protein [Candidatus Krumholzibacteria bacterium]
MAVQVALFRGINVGGSGVLPMKELVAVLEAVGCRNVHTYIQSGNAVFTSDAGAARLTKKIRAEINRRRGFEPKVLLLTRRDIERAMAKNPFPEATDEPKLLHLGFLSGAPGRAAVASLERLRAPEEQYRVIGSVLYLHLPAGAGRSRLAAGAEKALGVPMTVRNWRTVCKVHEMAAALD